MITNSHISRNNALRNGRRLHRKHSKQGGRITTLTTPITMIDDPRWQKKDLPQGKDGTICLDNDAYPMPQNDLPGITQLHLNENQFATAREAIVQEQIHDLMADFVGNLHSYPTNGDQRLQNAIATKFNILPEKIFISNGSANLLRELFFYLLKKNDTLLLPSPGWSYYEAVAGFVEAKIAAFSLVDAGDRFVYDKDVIAEAIEAHNAKVVLICSPNNPTGSVLPIEDLIALTQSYSQVNFILDEAYYGFSDAYTAEQERALLVATAQGNLFLVRTFSKFYGLANLRLGFLIANRENGRNLNKIAPVFGLPSFSQEIAAVRLANQAYAEQMKQEYTAVNDYMFKAFSQIPGMKPYQTHANFILVQHDGRWQALENTLWAHGYKIKRQSINGSQNYLRITYADMNTMKHFMSIIENLAKAGYES
jgi:histidinol-phosphate aminotransferase